MIVLPRKLFHMAAAAIFMLQSASAGAAETEAYPCMDELERFCKDVQPAAGLLVACLNGHVEELSPACRAKVERSLKRIEEATKLCEPDIQKFCADVTPGQGRVLNCMKSKLELLSPACREKVVQYGGHVPKKPSAHE
ncbi:hypothetical protein RHDC3_03111 [Rhodocyclaceae bacterium]|nr:hypothetical protein RHDC3_03111 [Rhodocyclaceae bacterium]